MRNNLNQIRAVSDIFITMQQNLLYLLGLVILGAFLGFFAKYLDGSNIGLIGTGIGFWILVTTIIAAWSRTPKLAALHVFIFLAAMLFSYYVYSMVLFGFFPKHYFIVWGSLALLSPISGYLMWFSRGNGWIAAICAAIPISLLIVRGDFFFDALTIPLYDLILPTGFDLFSAVLLLIILPKKNSQRLITLPIIVVLYYLIEQIDFFFFLPI